MASSFFKQFAIDNSLTVDYGYTYGKYKDFYISLKESLGTTKTLVIITRISSDKEKLKKILSVYGEELEKYRVCDVKREEQYLSFSFNLSNAEAYLVIEFLDKFIESYIAECGSVETLCPICNQPILPEEKITIIDVQGILMPAHDKCYDVGKQKVKEKVIEKEKEINQGRKGYGFGFLGSLVFSLIYILVLIIGFFFVQFLLNNTGTSDSYPFQDAAMGATIFQYAPSLLALSATPIIYTGYDVFKGRKGPYKILIILPIVILTTIIGTFCGFVFSLVLVSSTGLGRLFTLVFELLTPANGYYQFRQAFYIYIIVAFVLSLVSLLFKFNNKKEIEEANAATFEKLD